MLRRLTSENSPPFLTSHSRWLERWVGEVSEANHLVGLARRSNNNNKPSQEVGREELKLNLPSSGSLLGD